MSNVLIALATLIIGFILVTFGAYHGYHSAQRTHYANIVNRAMERQLVYVDMTKEDLGRVPAVADLVANRFTKENRNGVVFTYGVGSGYGYVCARSERKSFIDEAFQRVRDQWPNARLGGDCDTNTGPSSTHVSVTVRIS
jgi:hypothetical protein